MSLMKRLFKRKPLAAEKAEEEHHVLRRHFRAPQLISIGIGAIIGAGIFVITGQAAADYAGPAVVLSFVIAAIVCVFAGLCYAELSSIIPIAGGSYSYSYVAMGEFPAWIVGWSVIIQYLASACAVAVGWSGYFVSFLEDFGVHIPRILTGAPLLYDPVHGWILSGSFINLPAILIVALTCFLVAVGLRAAARFNNLMVFIKLGTIVLFVCIGVFHINSANWTPFIPKNTGVFGQFGWSGILRASGLVFFAYNGFDTVSTLAQETINPQKNLPRGILGSLAISTVAYIATVLVLTGIVSYTLLGVPAPLSVALNAMGPSYFWLAFIVQLAILAGLASVVLVQLLGQTRMFFAMSRDGLLPSVFSRVHHKLHTPFTNAVIIGIVSMVVSGLFPIDILGQLVSLAVLFIFAIVCLGVLLLRYRHPEYERPFKVPFVPYIPILGIVCCLAQMSFLPLVSWAQLIGWLLIGLVVYFGFSIKHSKLSRKS